MCIVIAIVWTNVQMIVQKKMVLGLEAMRKIILGVLAGLLMVPVIGVEARAGSFEIGIYGGVGESIDSDVKYSAGGLGYTHKNVEWDGDSFGPAPYWGARLTYWPSSMPNWGFMLDYTHAKMIADENSGGTPAGAAGNIGATYDRLEFTDGLNLVTVNALYQYDRWGSFKPYIGAGVGLAIPHVEVDSNGSNTREYQVTGIAAQVLVGGKYALDENFSLFGEYKLSYADIEADLENGGTLETEGVTNHFLVGISYKFGGTK